MPPMVETMPPISSDLADSDWIASVTWPVDSLTAAIALVASTEVRAPWSASSRASCAATAVSSALTRAPSTVRTWRSAPCATSPTACAISPTARPASSEVLAICWLASVSEVAVSDMRPTTVRTLETIVWNAVPSSSRSDLGSISTVRSPSATRRAAPARSRW